MTKLKTHVQVSGNKNQDAISTEHYADINNHLKDVKENNKVNDFKVFFDIFNGLQVNVLTYGYR